MSQQGRLTQGSLKWTDLKKSTYDKDGNWKSMMQTITKGAMEATKAAILAVWGTEGLAEARIATNAAENIE